MASAAMKTEVAIFFIFEVYELNEETFKKIPESDSIPSAALVVAEYSLPF
jgi:hypothetical protein